MPSTATRLVLVRHASTIWNRDNRYQGQSDVPLDETGRQEARQLAPRLAELAPASAYTSDLVRCRETVELALSHQPVPIFIDPRLREAHYGQWEGMTR
ncbi:MAG: histidine phosphatase family protein, partial [Deinococcus sp.]|nr:histidine phosphatase family protein [Deinococcus sp.]